jgi:hypothetical protein
MPRLVSFLLLAVAMPSAQAVDLYRWKDEKGITHYSDKPPPEQIKKFEVRKITGNVVEGQDSYALKTASQRYPITLYATDCGLLCDQARDFLSRRGLPYTARNPELNPDDLAALKKLIGSAEVPVLTVGRDAVKGFDAARWDSALATAGYPATSLKRGTGIAPTAAPTPTAAPARARPSAPSSAPSVAPSSAPASSRPGASGSSASSNPTATQYVTPQSAPTPGPAYRGSSVSSTSAASGASGSSGSGEEQVTSWPSAYLAHNP